MEPTVGRVRIEESVFTLHHSRFVYLERIAAPTTKRSAIRAPRFKLPRRRKCRRTVEIFYYSILSSYLYCPFFFTSTWDFKVDRILGKQDQNTVGFARESTVGTSAHLHRKQQVCLWAWELSPGLTVDNCGFSLRAHNCIEILGLASASS